MSETTMPAAEATVATNDELSSYELAFHVLPTVAEGEVATIEQEIINRITEVGGTVGLREAAQRFDLAYELQKMIDGKYRRFTTSYFGWIRFTAEPAAVAELLAEVEAMPNTLRALLIRLTRQEEAHPFYLHEALAARKQVTTIDLAEPADDDADEATETEDEAALTDAEDATMEESDDTADDTVKDEADKPAA
jgi:ribosomal protein S6